MDTHESPANVTYRNQFIDRYFGYELLAHRWYSITKQQNDTMIENGEIEVTNNGYGYEINGEIHVEYHVDTHISFQEACASLQYGDNLSIRKPDGKKKTMIFGQDEYIFKQYAFTNSAWTLPNGTKALIPKDEGQGVMISAFCSRELGYGPPLTPQSLAAINRSRKGNKYSDEKAAVSMNGKADKKELTTSPFVTELEYGQNKEGYWSYYQMVLQLEDCIDVLKWAYPDFDFIFLFDHSNGHDRFQPDGLNMKKVSSKYGGKQPVMRSSLLSSKDFFGPYHTPSYPLQVGYTQLMQFTENDPGPCYLSEAIRVAK